MRRARRQHAHELVERLEGRALVKLDLQIGDADEVRGERRVVVGVVPVVLLCVVVCSCVLLCVVCGCVLL